MGQSIAPLMFGSAFTNLLTASMSSSSQASLNRQMMGFNARENQKNRDWQQQMYNQQKYDQMNFYNMFQSPQAVARQLSAIGVNPTSVMSQGSGIGASPVSMPSPPGGSAASVSGLQNPDSYYQQAIDSTTKMVDSISNSYLREKQALNVISQTQGQEFANKIAAFNAYLTEKYGENEKIQNIRNLVADVALKTANKDYTEAQTSLNEIMQKIQNKELDIKDEEYSQLLINGSFLVQQLNDMHNLNMEQQKTEKSKQSSNYASASLSNALKKESGLRSAGIEFDNVSKKIDSENAASLATEKLYALKMEIEKSKALSREEKARANKEAEKLEYRIKHYHEYPGSVAFDEFFDNLPIIGGIIRGLK